MAAYVPELVAELAQCEDTRILADSAATTMVEDFGLTSDAVWDILQRLDSPDCRFIKSMPSKYSSGEALDVYHVRVPGVHEEVYLKLKVSSIPRGTMNRVVAVLSFKSR